MRAKSLILIGLLMIAIHVLVGCGVPDIDNIDQQNLRGFTPDMYHTPPDPVEHVYPLGNQTYETQITTKSGSLVVVDNQLVCRLTAPGLAAGEELVAILDATFSGANPPVPTYQTWPLTGLFADNTYHLGVGSIIKRTGQAEFLLGLVNGYTFDITGRDLTVSVTYEYSTHYDNNASNATYDPKYTGSVPSGLYWSPAKTYPVTGSVKAPVIGYRLFRNWITSGAVTAKENVFFELKNFDGKSFAASGTRDVDTSAANPTWVHTTTTTGKDTSLTTGTLTRQNWEDSYTYCVVTVDEFGATSRWSENLTLRTKPQVTFPNIDVLTASYSRSGPAECQVQWSYAYREYNEGDTLDSFNIYGALLPPTTSKALAETPLLFKLAANDANNDIDPELFSTDLNHRGFLITRGAVNYIAPYFYWLEAQDKSGNLSRRSSVLWNPPGY